MDKWIFLGMHLPGIVPKMGPVHATGFGAAFPVDGIFCDLDLDFPGIGGPAALPHGDGTIYQLPLDRTHAIDRACKFHGWQSLTVGGTITFASDAFGPGGSALYRGPTDDPVGGEITVNIPDTFVSLSSLPTTSIRKWFQMSNQLVARERVYDISWPGRNAAGNVTTQAEIDAFSLDWIMPLVVPTAPLTNPASLLSVPGTAFGHEIYRAAFGNYNWYSGSDVVSWPSYPTPPPPTASVPFDIVIRASAFGNCGCVRYNEGVWQYPALVYFHLLATIEPSAGYPPWSGGYFGAPPIAGDTDGSGPGDFGTLIVGSCRYAGADPDASGVSMKWDTIEGGEVGPIVSQNFSIQYIAGSTGGTTGGAGMVGGNGFASPARSRAALTIHHTDPVRWQAPI